MTKKQKIPATWGRLHGFFSLVQYHLFCPICITSNLLTVPVTEIRYSFEYNGLNSKMV